MKDAAVFMLGLLTAAALLGLNYTLLADMEFDLMTVYIAGLRIHHGLVGLILFPLGAVLALLGSRPARRMGIFLLGFSIPLIADDLHDLGRWFIFE